MYLFTQPANITSCNGDCVILLKYDVIGSLSVINNNFNEVRLYTHSFLLFFALTRFYRSKSRLRRLSESIRKETSNSKSNPVISQGNAIVGAL